MTELSVWCAILGDCHQCSTNFDQYGGFVVYIFFVLYSFYVLAQLCDGHLTTCLEIIVKKFGLSEDVAGATFLAMASSAPELFHSIVATFVLPSPSGVGNIVGSALFNLLCIIGVLPLVSATGPLSIWWYPTMRDASFYALAIVEIYVVILDGRVVWWEALIMVLSYGLYVLYFVMNERIIKALGLKVPESEETEGGAADAEAQDEPKADVPEVFGRSSEILPTQAKKLPGPPSISLSAGNRCWDGILSSLGFSCLKRQANTKANFASMSSPMPGPKAPEQESNNLWEAIAAAAEKTQVCADQSPEKQTDSVEPDSNSWTSWLAQFRPPVPEPGMWLIDYLMPDPEKKIILSFSLCCVWIAIYTYVMVECAGRLGCFIGVPEVVMGLTILAAGTSVPDMIASMSVARDGHADMAAANAVGSNTFDIMLGLGMPWLVLCAFGKEIPVPTAQLSESIYILAGALAFYLIAIVFNKWVLNRAIGFSLLGIYVGSIIFAIVRNYTHYSE